MAFAGEIKKLLAAPNTIVELYNNEMVKDRRYNTFLRQFRIWFINEKIEQCRQINSRAPRPRMINSPARIWWIEKLLQTPIYDYRKFIIRRILVPYLINIKSLAGDEG
ncbi:MAG: hypothetical protein ACTHKP_15915 [Nitrososphaeraceae archaeon]